MPCFAFVEINAVLVINIDSLYINVKKSPAK